MNIKLLRAYDEARMLRLSGKRVPSELLHHIKRMEEDFISKDLISFLKHHLQYFLQGYESPVSLNVEFDPLTHDISIQSITSEAGNSGVKKVKSSLHSSMNKKTSAHQGRTDNAPNQYLVNSYYSQQQTKSGSKETTQQKTTQQNKLSIENNNMDNTDEDLKKYFDDFRRMKRRSGAMGIKKAVMLLSMFDLIGNGHFKSNEMVLDDTLVNRFGILWDSIVPREDKGVKDVCRAFVQLYRESFVRMELNKSFSNIDGHWDIESVRDVIKSVSFDGILFRLVQNQSTCIRLIEFLGSLFNLRIIIPSVTIVQRHITPKEEPILEDGVVIFDENYDEVDVNDFILNSNVDEYNQDEIANLKSSDFWKASAIATLGNKKKSYVIYDTSIHPLTKERIIRFMLKMMITRDLLSYRCGSEVSERIHNLNNLDILDSLMKCTLFQEVDPNTGKKTNHILTMKRSIKTFQIYTEFRNLTQKVYDCLMGDMHQELPNEFTRFVKMVARQAFIP